MALTTRGFDTATVLLAAWVIAGLYSDGWAHLNRPGLESFFTPWHGLLYSGFVALTATLAVDITRRHPAGTSWRYAVPLGHGWSVVGIGVFVTGALGDMAWHTIFGIEAGIDALVSPTHLLLLTGGTLLLAGPWRAVAGRTSREAASVTDGLLAAASLGLVAALVGFFVSYISVFVSPEAVHPLTTIAEGAPGHMAAEAPAAAGLGGYLVTTVVILVPLMYLRRTWVRPPSGGLTVITAVVSLSASALTGWMYVPAALGATIGAAIAEAVAMLVRRRTLEAARAAMSVVLVWAGQLTGLAMSEGVQWPVELWAGVVTLSALAGATLAHLAGGRSPLRRLPSGRSTGAISLRT